ncbi:putative RNA-directed DNA polymerase [Helianthus annuus]|uniref:RNA-directed DNA polymerase n=1 Tax=Helianthus annuus TaxID=4232 RepID=A0A9K3DG68_HELAN|nr:putative RNA-directed DNA polymerase [Helianthus annuus]
MTFIVQNLSDRSTKMMLWRAFQPFGYVSDAYVARKKDKRGNCFGFIRYVGVENVDSTVEVMNKVKILEAKVSVSLAKYDKNHKKFIYTSKTMGEKTWRPKEPYHTNPRANEGTNSGGAEFQRGKSYASLFQKDVHQSYTGSKVLSINIKGSAYPLHCINRSIHGVVKNLHVLNNLNNILSRSGLSNFGLSYVGGLSVLLTLGNSGRVKDVMTNYTEGLANAFSQYNVWKGEDLSKERIVSLRISGLPIQLRDNTVFDQIGGLFGKVVEEVAAWKPDLDGYNVSVELNSGHATPETSDADSNEDRNMEEVEEDGEIRSPAAEAPVPENIVRPSSSSNLNSGNEKSPVKVTLDNEEAVHVLHGKSHGHMEFHNNSNKGASRTVNIEAKKLDGGPQLMEENRIGNTIYSNQEGPTPSVGLGKRNRANRSPPSSGSMQGPPTRGFFQDPNSCNVSIDLNRSTSESGSRNGEYVGDDYRSVFPSDDTYKEAPTGEPMGAGEYPVEPGDNIPVNPSVTDEVLATSVIGLCYFWFSMKFLSINLRGVRDSRKADRIRGIITSYGVHFLAIQETKLGDTSNFSFNGFWGRSAYQLEVVSAEGRSGGLACLWNPGMFTCDNVIKNRYFLALSGSLNQVGIRINLVNVYASNDANVRRVIWDSLVVLKNSLQGLWVFMGDFNEVRDETERFNSEFIASNAEAFNQFILATGLSEFQMGGGRYTYISDRGDKLSKLDRFLVCLGFLEKWPTTTVLALNRDVSDHRPILLSTTPSDFSHILFRCYNSWMEIPGFMELVKQLCTNFVFHGSADMALSVKLRWLKNHIKAWIKVVRENSDGVYLDTKKRINMLERLAEERALEEEELHERAECINIVLDMDRRKQLDARQKSRARWALDGDENSAFFHNIINSNLSNNLINGLLIDGVWNSNPVIIKEAFFDFFSKQFVEPMSSRPYVIGHNLATLSTIEANILVEPFSITEIKEAIWGCVGDRAPGPDGFNFKFIKKNWDLFQGDFIRLFQEFYDNGSINKCCSSSFIALIPKVKDPSSPSNFRPISLIGVVNKAISKVLVNRLKRVIGRLVSEEQSAFLAGRNISDGPLILNEAIAWMKKAKKSGMIFKVDINKAYDSLNWSYLDSIMSQMNFPDRWRSWIMATLTTSRASVLVNASPTMEFEYSRGLRQGDPLSPFLFVLAMEALTGIMKKAVSEGIFNGLQCTSNGPVLSHLIYADDVVFLGEWSSENVNNLRRLLRCFHLVSGLKVNLAKCSLFGIGIDELEVQQMADSMGCKKGTFPFKHLGLVVGANMNLIRNWKPVIDVFKNRLSLWKAKNLSYGGRITLLKSVLNALRTYFFSLYKAPAKVLDILERLRRVFFWGGSDDNSPMSWLAWEKVIAPIEYGGLGFGSLCDANLAMLSKWWWRFKTDKEGLWRRVVWAIHHNSRSWTSIPAKVSVAGSWKQIVGIRAQLDRVGIHLSDSIWCKIGCGSKSSFWLDYWIGNKPLYCEFPLLFALERDKLCLVSDRVGWGADSVILNWSWKRPVMSDGETNELLALSLLLCDFDPSEGQDRWVWEHDNSGNFTVASIKQILASAGRVVPEYQFVWNNYVPKKVGIVPWRALMERLPTRIALAARNVDISDIRCVLCGDYDESSEHLFVSCQFAQSVWLVMAMV